MPRRVCILLFTLSITVATGLPAVAQLLPESTPKPAKPPAAKPAQIVVQTSPNAEVYFDGEYRGRAGSEGRLVIANPKPGEHNLRVSLTGRKDFQQKITVVAGRELKIPAALADLLPTAGEVRQNLKDGLKYVWIPPGNFMMGCSPGDSECFGFEKPVHQVTITEGVWVAQTDVAVSAYKRFAAATGRQMPDAPFMNTGWANENMPIVNVTWDDARKYCAWAGGRLLTEAEWEYAARGGSVRARYGNIDDVAWYDQNSGGRAHEVAQKRANGFGLYDVLGNVWEWVNDWYDERYYQESPSQDPPGPARGQVRVLRGGAWGDQAWGIRVSDRRGENPEGRYSTNGFRCAREVLNP